MDMHNVHLFPGVAGVRPLGTTDAKAVLDGAAEAGLMMIGVVGYDQNGKLYVASTSPRVGELHYLLSLACAHLTTKANFTLEVDDRGVQTVMPSELVQNNTPPEPKDTPDGA